jgi:uncharacterized protein (TIGR02246 family)
MNSDGGRIVSDLVGELEEAWNAADGAGFARPFAEDADFVNIRGEHLRTREVIAKGHQAIFNTIYAGSVIRYEVTGVRAIAPAVLLAHVKGTLKAPTGPLAGEHHSLFTVVLVQDQNAWSIAAFHNTLIM